ncbi:MAG: hypothetical protein GY757_01705 [bacterium]|nr:hypothetical protein [bacterium]
MSKRHSIEKIAIYFSFLFILSTLLLSAYPTLVVTPNKRLSKLLVDIDEFEKYVNEIVPSLKKEYLKMWKEFDKNGAEKLPWCVFSALNALKSKKSILFTFSIANRSTFPDGARSIWDVDGMYVPNENEQGEQGIIIYGLWKRRYTQSMDLKSKKLTGLLFHEILHYALHIRVTMYSDAKPVNSPSRVSRRL